MGAWAVGVCASAWLTALSVFDIRDRRLPNWLTLPGAVAALAVACAVGRGAPAACGALALFAVYLLVHLARPAAMGAGDVKLAAGIGALTGAFGIDVWMLAALAAPMLTAIVALTRRSVRTVPHGPSMCAAALLVICGQFVALSAPQRAQIGAARPTCENGTRVAMDYRW